MPNTLKMSLTLRLQKNSNGLMRLPSLSSNSALMKMVKSLPTCRHPRPSRTFMITKEVRRRDGDSIGRKSKCAEASIQEHTSSRRSTIHKICSSTTNAHLEPISSQQRLLTILRTKSSRQRSSSPSGLWPGSLLLMSDHPQWLSGRVHTTSASTRVSLSHLLLSNSRVASIDQHLGTPPSME